jgi:predicted Zn finger-like uncharacterized protein
MKIVCPACSFSREVPEEKIPPKTKIATCPKCGHRFQFRNIPELNDPVDTTTPSDHSSDSRQEDIWDSLSAMNSSKEAAPLPGSTEEHNQREQSAPNEQGPQGAPWEHLDEVGFFPGFIETLKQVMLHPIRFFRDTAFTPGIGKALVFYLLIAEVQALAQFFWQMTGVIPMMGESAGEAALGLGMIGMGSALILIFYPILLTMMLFFVVGLNHLCLHIFRAASQGFVGTFKAVTYGSAPMVLAVFPLVGPLVGALWTMVTTFFGYKYIHKTTTTKVVLAMLLPVMVMALLILAMLIVGSMSTGTTG